MITTATQEDQDRLVKEEMFYNEDFMFSYSSLKKLLDTPQKFYKEYVLGDKDKLYGKYLREGSLIHFLLLESNCTRLEDRYAVMSSNMPSENAQAIIDSIVEENQEYGLRESLLDYSIDINDKLAEMNLYQSIKDDEKRVSKIADDRGIEYYEFLRTKGDKIVVDAGTLAMCVKRAEKIRQREDIMRLIGDITDNRTIKVWNEHEMQIPFIKDLNFGIKGILDNMVVDLDNMKVYINDFKTTSRSIKDFPESVEQHSYWLQAAMYYILVNKKLQLTKDWKIEFHFIVVDKDDNTYAYPVSDNTMCLWLTQFSDALKMAEYHYTNRKYDLPYNFDKGIVTL